MINLTLRQIEAFVAVAQNKSYTKASRVIGLSQPAITANVRLLEHALGVRLLDRTTRSVRMTHEGRGFLSAAERLLHELGSAIVDIRNPNEKRCDRVVIACLPSVAAQLVGPLMHNFAARYPGVTISIHDGDALDVVNRVRSQDADFGISSYAQPDADMEFVPLLRDRFCLLCNKAHPLARKKAVCLKDLEGHAFLVLGSTSGTRPILNEVMIRAGIRLNIVCETKQLSTLAGMIRAGIGISLVPEACVLITGASDLVAKPLLDSSLGRDLGLVLCQGRALSPAAESFRRTVVDQMPVRWKDFTATVFGT